MKSRPNSQSAGNKNDAGKRMPPQKDLIGRRTFITSSLATLALLPACSSNSTYSFVSSPEKLARFKQDRFCISFWVGPPADAQMGKHYAQLAAANFTVVMGGFGADTPETDRRQQLDLCGKYGLKALVYLSGYEAGAIHGPADNGQIKQADKFPNHPACWGYMLHDEPSALLFPNLRYMVNYLRRARPGKLGYINLFPNYASAAQLGARSYEEYVSRFVREVNPDVLCMDYYPMMEPHANSQDGYCANLAVLRTYALQRSIPFWNYFNAMPFGGHSDPTEAQMRWQINTSLAYGAKGVLYFCYWTPGGFRHGGALISAAGRPTRHYDQARRINAKLKNLGPTLMQLTSEAVHRIPRGANPATALKGSPLKSITPGDYLIGVYKHTDGRAAVLLNNYSWAYAAWPTVEFAANLKNIVEVDPDTGREIPVADASPNMPGLQISLGAAEGRLFLIPQSSQ
ncbi:MAG: hypothetical protein HKL95_04420 [Phycisphaerae bacterium]|nr:hypothetical protein [Phycisphaerae bacterium]